MKDVIENVRYIGRDENGLRWFPSDFVCGQNITFCVFLLNSRGWQHRGSYRQGFVLALPMGYFY
jgi:hypothetical protein